MEELRSCPGLGNLSELSDDVICIVTDQETEAYKTCAGSHY